VPKITLKPNLDRISVIAATILLAYTFAGLIKLTPQEYTAQLPGIYISFQIDSQTIVSLLTALIAAAGASWLLQEHPSREHVKIGPHLLLPAMTAWVIGFPLNQRDLGFYWWIGLFLGGGTIISVLIAEFIVVDNQHSNFRLATIGLTTVAYSLFFLSSVILKSNQTRLYLLVPAISIIIFFVSLRTLGFYKQTQMPLIEASICTLVMTQISIASFYLPLGSFSFGFFLLGPAYGLNRLFINIIQGKKNRDLTLEPVSVMIVFWSLSVYFFVRS
jgi:hypothetical protein